MIKVTVVIPVYNIEAYIGKCIDSIINQTLKDIEILIIDDGSTDNSAKICDNYKQKDNRIRVIHKKNGGLSSARNKGIELARGNYICFIDGDDYIDEDMIELLYKNAINNNADIVECGYRFVYEKYTENQGIEKSVICDNIQALNYFLDSRCFTSVAWNKLYKIDLFNDIKYPDGCIHEDIGTTYKLIYKSKKLISLSDIKYNYLQRDSSISYMNFTEKHLVAIQFWEEIYKLMKEIKDIDLENKSLRNLISFIVVWYERAKKCGIKDKAILNKIHNTGRKYLKYSMSSKISIKQKIGILIFTISPQFCIKMKNILD